MNSYSFHKNVAVAAFIAGIVLITSNGQGCCSANVTPLTDPKRDGYSRRIRDLKSHPVSTERVPPIIMDAPGNDKNSTNYMQVMLSIVPVDVLGLEAAKQVLEVSGYISIIWNDYSLAWNASDYGGVTNIEMPASYFWTPALLVSNGVENKNLVAEADHPISISNVGLFILTFPVNLKTSCDVDLTFFPFDHQTCGITIMPLTHTLMSLQSVNLSTEKVRNLLEPVQSREWAVVNISAEIINGNQYRSHAKDARFILKLQRKTTYYIVSIITPMVLFTMMDCLVFLIPPDSGEKISFVISIFISNAIFSSFLSGIIPLGLDKKLPLLLAYQLFMWAWSMVVFLMTVIVLKRYNREQAATLQRASPCSGHDSHIPLQRASPCSGHGNHIPQQRVHPCSGHGNIILRPRQVNSRQVDIRKRLIWAVTSRFHSHSGKVSAQEDRFSSPSTINLGPSNETIQQVGQNADGCFSQKSADPNPRILESSVEMSAEQLDRIFLIVSLTTVIGFDFIIAMLVMLFQ